VLDVLSKLKILSSPKPQYYQAKTEISSKPKNQTPHNKNITTMSFQKIELYGGAMTVDLPSNFSDVR
jgi:hypothetical protein